jgi:hypothetical protein
MRRAAARISGSFHNLMRSKRNLTTKNAAFFFGPVHTARQQNAP